MSDKYFGKCPNYSQKTLAANMDQYVPGTDDSIINSVKVDPQTGLLGYQLIVRQGLLAGHTAAQIKNDLATCHPDVQFEFEKKFRTMLKFTALGIPFFPPGAEVNNKGPKPYLGPEDLANLANLCLRFEANQNPVNSFELFTMASSLKSKRIESAYILLRRFPALIRELNESDFTRMDPPADFVADFTNLAELDFSYPTYVDQNRLYAACPARLRLFFQVFGPTIMLFHPSMVFNGDELGVSSDGTKFKVIHSGGGVAPRADKVPHVSAFCCVSATGVVVPPQFVLTKIKKFPAELECFRNKAWFSGSKSGWQTELTFYGWCLSFAHWTTEYRARLPAHRQNSWILLILDGHPSRACPEALGILAASKIHLLIFPSHCTQVLQPFDVCLASPMRSFFNRFRRDSTRVAGTMTFPTAAARIRYIIIDALLRAWVSAASVSNVAAGFRTTGIYPTNVEKALESPFSIDGEYVPPKRQAVNISGTIPTSPAMFQKILDAKVIARLLWPVVTGNVFVGPDQPLGEVDAIEWLAMTNKQRRTAEKPEGDGRMLTPPGPVGYVMDVNGVQGWFFAPVPQYRFYKYN